MLRTKKATFCWMKWGLSMPSILHRIPPPQVGNQARGRRGREEGGGSHKNLWSFLQVGGRRGDTKIKVDRPGIKSISILHFNLQRSLDPTNFVPALWLYKNMSCRDESILKIRAETFLPGHYFVNHYSWSCQIMHTVIHLISFKAKKCNFPGEWA